jgi:hypothetical protein
MAWKQKYKTLPFIFLNLFFDFNKKFIFFIKKNSSTSSFFFLLREISIHYLHRCIINKKTSFNFCIKKVINYNATFLFTWKILT